MTGSERKSRDAQPRLAPAIALATMLAAIGLVYANAMDAAFVWDDHLLLGPSSPIVAGDGPGNPFSSAFWELGDRETSSPYYRPLTILSLALDHELWGTDPRGFHRTNVGLHLCVCALVFLLARRLGAGMASATLATLLWGLFPRLTEAVTFVSGRTDLLAALAALAAVALHTRHPDEHLRRALAALALLMGLLCKEVALAGGAAIVTIECLRMQRNALGLRRAAVQLLPLLVSLLAYAVLRSIAGVSASAPSAFSLSDRIASAFQALGQYVVMVATPWKPNLVIGSLGVPSWKLFAVGLVAAAGIALLARAIITQRIRPQLSMMIVLGLAAIAPVLHVIPISLRALAADRYLYLPLAALAIVSAAELRLPPAASRGCAAVAMILACAFGVWTHERNSQWADEETLWRVTAREAPAFNGLPHLEYANILGQRGKTQEAIRHYRESLEQEVAFRRLRPTHVIPVSVLSSYGLVLAGAGRDEEALGMLAEVVRARPNEPEGWLNLGAALSRSLRFDEAERAFAKALELYPGYASAKQARRQNRAAARLWSLLPAPAEGEAAAIRSQRAEVYFQVGRLGRANELWMAALASPDVGPDEIAAATRALKLQHEVVGETEESLALQRALSGHLASVETRPDG